MNTLLSTGQFAKLASTTKRTIAWYDVSGILKPIKKIGRYRYYEEKQILDYQMIHLLTTLGISLDDIAEYLKHNKSITSLFETKKDEIKDQIKTLQCNLNSIETLNENLDRNETMVEPTIRKVKPFEIYYIEKEGSYSDIDKYCTKLQQMFENALGKSTTMTIFLEQGYRPKHSIMKICLIPKSPLIIKPEFVNIVKYELFDPGKVICHTHRGSGSILSLFWKQLEKYCKEEDIIIRETPMFEIYHVVSKKPWEQRFEIFIPIK